MQDETSKTVEGDKLVNQAIEQIECLVVEGGLSTEAMAILQQEREKIGSVMRYSSSNNS